MLYIFLFHVVCMRSMPMPTKNTSHQYHTPYISFSPISINNPVAAKSDLCTVSVIELSSIVLSYSFSSRALTLTITPLLSSSLSHPHHRQQHTACPHCHTGSVQQLTPKHITPRISASLFLPFTSNRYSPPTRWYEPLLALTTVHPTHIPSLLQLVLWLSRSSVRLCLSSLPLLSFLPSIRLQQQAVQCGDDDRVRPLPVR